jgi:putative cardiolipin synthase
LNVFSRVRCVFMIGVVLASAACGQLPDLGDRSVSMRLSGTDESRIGRMVAPLARSHPGKSGVVALADAHDAFAARVLFAEAAEHSIDVQYYIWRLDMSGTWLFESLHRAAERGVRVRLLLDDNNTTGLDEVLAALDAHPRIEVRLFNPFLHRRWRALGYLTDFSRLNRRMHNKSFTIDNQVTIIGGRNVGDEYFGAGEGLMFADLDVMAIGPVVEQVSDDFDRYWASQSSYPVSSLLPAVPAEAIDELERLAARVEKDPAAAQYVRAVFESSLLHQLLNESLSFEWAATRMISDDPAKGLGLAAPETLFPLRLGDTLGTPTSQLHLISPYFVPMQQGVEMLTALAAQGVQVTVLTNSLEATDVAAVHAGYAKRREPLLEAGISLYETKRSASVPAASDRGLPGSSGSSLHAKTFVVDRQRVFIGSFNLDPRSAALNTENGFVIESPSMATSIADLLARRAGEGAYQVRLDEGGDLQWVERDQEGREQIHEQEPGAGFWRRVAVAILAVLPIEWLL